MEIYKKFEKQFILLQKKEIELQKVKLYELTSDEIEKLKLSESIQNQVRNTPLKAYVLTEIFLLLRNFKNQPKYSREQELKLLKRAALRFPFIFTGVALGFYALSIHMYWKIIQNLVIEKRFKSNPIQLKQESISKLMPSIDDYEVVEPELFKKQFERESFKAQWKRIIKYYLKLN